VTTRLALLRVLLAGASIAAVSGCGPAGTSPDARSSAGATAAAAPSGTNAITALPITPAPAGPETTFPGTVILGAPTDSSVVVSLLASSNLELYAEYGTTGGRYDGRTDVVALTANSPTRLTMNGLAADSAVYYRLRFRAASGGDFLAGAESSFRTQRAEGQSFTFAVDADPHIDIDKKTQPDLLRLAYANVASAGPDFLVDLGDTFLGDKFARTRDALAAQYASTRDYFGIFGASVPLYLANGNHEGEDGWVRDGTADNLGVWAATCRLAYYPTPVPGDFYSSGASDLPFIGRPDSYYAWQWGDALFVVIDPYTYTVTDPRKAGDMWGWTLGDEQYHWLASTLASSAAKYKVVFSHHVIGDVRGMIEWVDLYEWGGHGKSGAWEFEARRPGWELPIHDLFVKYGVTIFFQGHDHFYARQELDGVVYQEVPQPATPDGNVQNKAHEYAYKSGTILGSPGHLEVSVESSGVTVTYIHAGSGDKSGLTNGAAVTSYTVPARSGT
jgi:hypothetical protein